MTKQVFRLLLSVSVWLVLTSFSAQAQAINKMTVKVPFDFNVRDQHYAAGTYSVWREGAFMSLRDHNGRTLNVLLANPLVTQIVPHQSKLVFFEYHGLHLLTQIIWEGDETGSEFVRAGREEEVARQITTANVMSAQLGGK
jgi:hypothetical protein